DRGQQLLRRQDRIDDERDVHTLGQLREQITAGGGLARAHLTRELDEATPFPDPVQEVGQRLLVTRAQVDKARVRRVREGPLREPEVSQVHRGDHISGHRSTGQHGGRQTAWQPGRRPADASAPPTGPNSAWLRRLPPGTSDALRGRARCCPTRGEGLCASYCCCWSR